MNKRKIIVNETDKQYTRWQEYRQVWINKWNLICVKVVAIISFIVIITVIVVKNIPDQSDDGRSGSNGYFKHRTYLYRLEMDQTPIENDCTYTRCSYWGDERCCFHCYRINIDAVPNIINNKYNQNKCTAAIILTLVKVNFQNGIMEKSWWNSNIHVIHFFLKSCYLLDIEDGAFNSKPFGSTKTITFSKSQIPYYRKYMFTGMKSLTDFGIQDSDQAEIPNQFQDPDPEGIKFEFGVLENVKDTLITLQVQGSIINPEAIRNLTGIEMNALQIIDFRSNHKLATIPDGAFKTKSLKELSISDNDLREINDNAFIDAPSVERIYLQNNKLQTINEQIFRSFTIRNEIKISKNKWICNCNFKFITEYTTNDIDTTTCDENTSLRESLNKCEGSDSSEKPTTTSTTIESTTTESTAAESTTTESTTTESTTTESTTTESTAAESTTTESTTTESTTSESTTSSEKPTTTSTTTTESTTSSSSESISTPSSSSSEDYQPKETTKNINGKSCQTIRNHFKIDTRGPEDILITYNGTSNATDHFILLTTDVYACDITDKIGRIQKADTAYIMCKHNEKELDCFSGRTDPVYDEQIWLKNSERTPVILIGFAVTVLASILSGVGVFYCIRKYPKLLRGNKKLAFVRGPTTDVVMVPSKSHSPVYLSPLPLDTTYGREVSYIPVRDAAYLTPISQRYMQVRERYERPGLKRSLSDLSMKTVASYVTENQLMSSKGYSRPERVSVCRGFEDPLPPPLPPPRKRCEEVIVHESDLRNRNTHYW